MAKVVVMDHPLIQHKIGYIRRMDTGTKDFRQTISKDDLLDLGCMYAGIVMCKFLTIMMYTTGKRCYRRYNL